VGVSLFMTHLSQKSKMLLFCFLLILIGTNLITYFIFGSDPPKAETVQEPPDYLSPLPEGYVELELFAEVLDRITKYYFEPVDWSALIQGAIDGMLKSLNDPQSTFFTAQELENFLLQTTGSFGGIGVRIVDVGEEVVIFEIIPGTPAEKAGLFPGDRISRAAGEDLAGRGVERAMELLRGPKGTSITISVLRPGADEAMEMTLSRDDIKMRAVTSRMLQPGLGYIKISSFDNHTGEDFTRQFALLEQEGLHKGLILDLRNNTGGLVDEAIKVAKLLVPAGEITRMVDRSGQARNIHYSSASPLSYPLVVLVNEETASAAEIVAGALQDRGTALLVGVKTYGKATVQHLDHQLPSDSALRLTVAKYLTPSGKDIHGYGLQPDYQAELPAALKYYRYFLPGRLSQGSYGLEVELLQSMLKELGYAVEPEGYFNQETAAALALFQKDAGLPATGIFDDLTWVELRKDLDKAARDKDPQLQKAIELTGKADLWRHLGR